MRLRKIKNAAQIIKESDKVVSDPFSYRGKWQDAFSNNQEIHLEIGMGKGNFIIESAIKNPNINYIGLEREATIVVKALNKLEEKEIPNLIFIHGDADNLQAMFSEAEIAVIYLNFSDPWPKNKHIKRRLTYDYKLKIYYDLLIDDGKIYMKTDNRKFFEYSLINFTYNRYKILDLSLNLHQDYNNIITTEYEDRFRKLGKAIYYIEVEKWKE